MARNTFDTSIEGIKSVWGPLSTEVVAACRGHLEDLLKAPATENWEDRFFKRPFPCPTAPRGRQNRGGRQRPKRLKPVFGCRLRCVGRGLLNRSSRKASFLALFTG